MARAADAIGSTDMDGPSPLYRDEEGPERACSTPGDPGRMAAITERVRLGPLVACTAFFEPGSCEGGDHRCDRRADARLGAGWNRREFEAFGLPWNTGHRASRSRSSIVRRLLAGEWVTFEGVPPHRPAAAARTVARLMVHRWARRSRRPSRGSTPGTRGDRCGNTPEGFAESTRGSASWRRRRPVSDTIER